MPTDSRRFVFGDVDVTLHLGDNRDFGSLDADAIVSDPPYGMNWDTNSKRFSGGQAPNNRRTGYGRNDWPVVLHDDRMFDPSSWLGYPKVVLWGANHYAQRLPVGTTLIWLKKHDHLFGTFLSDAEIGWMKGGHGVYAFRKTFTNGTRTKESGLGRALHPTQKPVALMEWCFDRAKIKPGSTVLDPYMGSGSTGVACLNRGMNFIGIEKSREYFDVAVKRFEKIKSEIQLWSTETE